MSECVLCNDVKDPKDIVEEYLASIYISLIIDGSIQDAKDAAFALFNEGYRLGYITSTTLRIEEDIETLKYVTNNF